MPQNSKRKTHSERAWEAYQKEKRLRKMQQEEMIRNYKIVIPVTAILWLIYYLFIR